MGSEDTRDALERLHASLSPSISNTMRSEPATGVPFSAESLLSRLTGGDDKPIAEQGVDGAESTEQAVDTEETPKVEGAEEATPQAEEEAVEEAGDADGEEQPAAVSSKETLEVRDASGRYREVEIDYEDRDKIRDYVRKAYGLERGMRKMQDERDKALSQIEQLTGKASQWEQLESVWKTNDVGSIVDFIYGKAGAFEEYVEAQLEERAELAAGSPETLELRKLQRQLKERDRKLEEYNAAERRKAEEASKLKKDEEKRTFNSMVEAAKKKYTFEGKLGDPSLEDFYNESVEQRVMRQISELREDGVQIDAELIADEYRRMHDYISGTIAKKAAAKADVLITKKKEQAKTAVRKSVDTKTVARPMSLQQEYHKLIASGQIAKALSDPRFLSLNKR